MPVADLKPAEGAAAVADGDDDTVIAASGQADGDDIADQVQMVKDRRDRRDEGEEPADKEAAMGVIAQQDGDMDILFDIIDTLLAGATLIPPAYWTGRTAMDERAAPHPPLLFLPRPRRTVMTRAPLLSLPLRRTRMAMMMTSPPPMPPRSASLS